MATVNPSDSPPSTSCKVTPVCRIKLPSASARKKRLQTACGEGTMKAGKPLHRVKASQIKRPKSSVIGSVDKRNLRRVDARGNRGVPLCSFFAIPKLYSSMKYPEGNPFGVDTCNFQRDAPRNKPPKMVIFGAHSATLVDIASQVSNLLPSGLYRRLRSSTGSCVKDACGLYRRSGIGSSILTLPRRLDYSIVLVIHIIVENCRKWTLEFNYLPK